MPDRKYEEWKDNLPEETDEIVEEVKELHGFNDEEFDEVFQWAYEVEKAHLAKIKKAMEKDCSEAVALEVEKEIDASIADDIAEMQSRLEKKNDETD